MVAGVSLILPFFSLCLSLDFLPDSICMVIGQITFLLINDNRTYLHHPERHPTSSYDPAVSQTVQLEYQRLFASISFFVCLFSCLHVYLKLSRDSSLQPSLRITNRWRVLDDTIPKAFSHSNSLQMCFLNMSRLQSTDLMMMNRVNKKLSYYQSHNFCFPKMVL